MSVALPKGALESIQRPARRAPRPARIVVVAVPISKVECVTLKLEGFTTRARHGVVFEVTESILGSGGVILDHQQFSNLVLRLSIEIWRERLGELLAGIEAAGVSLSRTSVEEAETISREATDARIAGSLVIRFVSDEPDLRVPAPAVPG